MLKYNFCKSFITLIVLSSLCFGQTSGGGSIVGGGGVLGGGKADSLLRKEVTSVFDKKIFTGLGKKIGKSTSTSKTTSTRKTSAKTKNAPLKSPTVTAQRVPLPAKNTQTPLNFKPVGDTGFDRELADLLTQNDNEKTILLTIFRETKKAYNIEAKKLGRENDVALATTFFISVCISVYHQSPNPSDAATEVLYNSLADSMLNTPETAQLSNQEKQLTSDKLIYLGGLIFSGYLIGKENGDRETIQAYRKIASDCFQSFTNLNVEDYEFTATGLKLNS